MYGIYYLMFTTFPDLFSGIYGFSAGISGLCYIGLGIGFFAATFFGASYADKIYLYVSPLLLYQSSTSAERVLALALGKE